MSLIGLLSTYRNTPESTHFMTFSSELNGIRTKNPVHREEGSGWISVQVPDCSRTPDYHRNYSDILISANYSDLPLIAAHRWRWIDGKIVTTVEQDGQYVTTTIEHLLLKRPRTEVIAFLNDDPTDARRVNLGEPRVRPEPVKLATTPDSQSITAKGDTGFVHLDNGMTVTIDRDCIDRVKAHRWYAINPTGNITFKANAVTPEGNPSTVTMHRLIINDALNAKKRVRFINGDRTDLRRANMQLEL